MKKEILFIVLITAVIALTGCGQKTGTLNMQITDAPAELNIEKAEITISQVQVHMAGDDDEEEDNSTNETSQAGWFTVVEEAQTFDLVEIKDVKEYLGSTELDVGKYTQIRLTIESGLVTIDGTDYDLMVPSGKLKLIKPFNIVADQNTTLTLDFDAEKSIHTTGNEKYFMKPTVKVIQE